MCYSKKYNNIVIIGNGFDLAHEYRTKYEQFLEELEKSGTKLPFEEIVNKIQPELDKKAWSKFEDTIQSITLKALRCDVDFPSDITQEEMQSSFKDLTVRLTNYLTDEIKRRKNTILKDSIKEYIDSKSFLINFNYTNVSDRYSKVVFHPHGSLLENNIIIGYDNRTKTFDFNCNDEPCVSEWEFMKRNKGIMRAQLNLSRSLKKTNVSPTDQKEYMQTFVEMQKADDSGKGFNEAAYQNYPGYEFVKKFDRTGMTIPDDIISKRYYKGVDKIIIIGHSLDADQRFVSWIISQCKNVKEMIVFYRDKTEKDNKKDFLRKWFDEANHGFSHITVNFRQYESKQCDDSPLVLKKEARL